MIRFTKSLFSIALKSSLACVLLIGGASSTFAQESKWKDQAEYDLYSAISKATSPDQQLQLLNQWKEKYPDSFYKVERAKV